MNQAAVSHIKDSRPTYSLLASRASAVATAGLKMGSVEDVRSAHDASKRASHGDTSGGAVVELVSPVFRTPAFDLQATGVRARAAATALSGKVHMKVPSLAQVVEWMMLDCWGDASW